MKRIQLIALVALLYLAAPAQQLTVIDQDYAGAVRTAAQENKLILVDFYTSWCGPCKKLDQLVFQNDSIKKQLGAHYILLKYNAEKDSIFNLSKKHHVMSYPTGLILDNNGYVLSRKYGFAGEDVQTLSSSVLAFTHEGMALARERKQLQGYSNTIAVSKYPQFYIDYINRHNVKIDTAAIEKYWAAQEDLYAEAFFSTLIYFADYNVPARIVDHLLKNKHRYEALFGKTDVEVLFFFLNQHQFSVAIANKDQQQFNLAVAFMKAALGQKYIDTVLPAFQ
jgi:thiol-disulfide isomerase/thioredoxin